MTPKHMPSIPPLTHRPVRILFVDDEPAFLQMLEHYFHLNGITAIAAKSGTQALVEITTATAPIDLLLTDYRMPGMDGLQLIKKLYTARPMFPVIFCSSYFPEDCLQEVEAISNKFYPIRCIEKPISPTKLCAYIREDIDNWNEQRVSF